ncbi:MAG TPA: DoxX family protein [Burkholderiales bacterium]|nr:DoxX family protein [Burkholderiales bacterium]
MATASDQTYPVAVAGGTPRDVAALIARVLLVALFLLSGFGKLPNFAGTAAYVASKGLPLPELGAAIAIAMEVGVALLVLVGLKARAAALALAVFTIATGVLFHAFWADADAAIRTGDFINFWKNVSIAGGFLMVFAFGPGRYSFDRG